MSKQEKKSFPLFPVKHWWNLRKKFKQSIPGTVTPNYLASVLGMRENSARDNVYLYLKLMKIIDKDGKPTPMATKWRDDHEYPKVCERIVKELYPQELIDAVPEPKKDKGTATRWFANHTGAGRVAIQKMVACYIILTEADPSKASETRAKVSQGQRKKKIETKQAKKEKIKTDLNQVTDKNAKLKLPEICINLQVHISSDASSDQIDQIFSSMSKHIYRR